MNYTDSRARAERLTQELMAQHKNLDDLKKAMLAVKLPDTSVHTLSPVEFFQVNSGALRVTDPCYDMETWCAGTLDKVKNGKWAAFVDTSADETDVKIGHKWFVEKVEALTDQLPPEHEKMLKDAENLTEEQKSFLAQLRLEREVFEAARSMIGIENMQGRVNYIHIHHEDHPITDIDGFERSEIDVGVDSGQAGFFDLGWFQSNQAAEGVKKRDDKAWDAFYHSLCEKTLETPMSFGAVEHGALSSSGWGDGSYVCYFKRDEHGEVIAARIVFLTPGEEEVEDEGDDE